MASEEVRVVFGLSYAAVPSLEKALEETTTEQFDFCVVPLVHPRNERDLLGHLPIERNTPLTRSDKILNSSEWTTAIVGRLSPWIDVDSPIADVRRNSEKAFLQEVAWAAHLGVPAVLLPAPKEDSANYAQILNETLLKLAYAQVWVRVPLQSPRSVYARGAPTNEEVEPEKNPWEWWNTLRTQTGFHSRLSVGLELCEDLPDAVVLDRWISEPVKAVFIPTRIFLSNKAGFPVLSTRHQAFVKRLMKVSQHFIITGNTGRLPGKGPAVYKDYLRHLRESVRENDKITAGYNDYLQAPLQPLADNLESAVYEVFEQDPIKYKLYEQSVFQALVDRRDPANPTKTFVVMVVGAGRGPLVTASLNAAKAANDTPVRVYAVEKNPNAVVTLKNMKLEVWGDTVTVVESDMRDWKAPEKADILVSELLGSFGDNELSPECIDGAQTFLKPDGISIPYDSTSFIVPLSTSKVFNDVASFKDREHFETPFVVKLENCWAMADIQPLFTFVHPNLDLDLNGQTDNSRFGVVRFTAKANGLMHGLAGYFESRLYKDVQLSIHPKTHTPGMFSWFPIFFPIKVPIYVTEGSLIEVYFWRKADKKKVWYEWSVRVGGQTSAIHNPAARSSSIGL